MSNVIKRTGKATRDIAKQSAKKVAHEPFEVLKSAASQATGVKTGEDNNMIAQAMTGDGKVEEISEIEEKQLESQQRRRLNELEGELAKLRHEREAKRQEWENTQEQMMAPPAQEEEILVEPTTRPKVGMMNPHKKKQGTREMGKRPSG